MQALQTALSSNITAKGLTFLCNHSSGGM